ncbi:MAG: ribonuclease H-like domain-containing protein [bacterium]|nr:ribonuclease H-like domain-containing protein [bacterium]
MELREKLDRLGVSGSRPPPAETARRGRVKLTDHVSGSECRSGAGPYFLSSSLFPENHTHGREPIRGWFDIPPDRLSWMGRDPALSGADLRRALFLDTETTGLAGGTGTVPFLVGLGAFDGTGFRVDQYFMRDLDEEKAALQAVAGRLEEAGLLVTYNGKCFDAALLASRFTLRRMRTRIREIPHVDLLFTARRIWKRRLVDCSLSNVENRVIGFRRQDDVPGFLIPGLYFDWLRTRNAAGLAPVFRHNVWDILALAALGSVAGRMYVRPLESIRHPQDGIGLGRAFESLGRFETAASCYHRVLEGLSGAEEREEALFRLGFSLKRSGDWAAMAAVWERATREIRSPIRAWEELAKYHEHRSGDLQRALEAVNAALSALDILEAVRQDGGVTDARDRLIRRLERVRSKMARKEKTFKR